MVGFGYRAHVFIKHILTVKHTPNVKYLNVLLSYLPKLWLRSAMLAIVYIIILNKEKNVITTGIGK